MSNHTPWLVAYTFYPLILDLSGVQCVCRHISGLDIYSSRYYIGKVTLILYYDCQINLALNASTKQTRHLL